jgi:hypothetical protein
LGETVFCDLPDDPTSPAEVFRADLLTLRAGTIAVKVGVELDRGPSAANAIWMSCPHRCSSTTEPASPRPWR